MAMVTEDSVHTMPLEALRGRAGEARRLLAQAREIARLAFDNGSDTPPASSDGNELAEGTDPSRRVGLLLDAAQRLLPGIPPLAEEGSVYARIKKPTSGWRRVTLRGGADRALDSIERAELLEAVAGDAAILVAEIERRSSSMFRAAGVTAERETRSS
jgi:hypothetical protein